MDSSINVGLIFVERSIDFLSTYHNLLDQY